MIKVIHHETVSRTLALTVSDRVEDEPIHQGVGSSEWESQPLRDPSLASELTF